MPPNAEEQPHYTIWSSKSGYFDAGWKNSNWAKQTPRRAARMAAEMHDLSEDVMDI